MFNMTSQTPTASSLAEHRFLLLWAMILVVFTLLVAWLSSWWFFCILKYTTLTRAQCFSTMAFSFLFLDHGACSRVLTLTIVYNMVLPLWWYYFNSIWSVLCTWVQMCTMDRDSTILAAAHTGLCLLYKYFIGKRQLPRFSLIFPIVLCYAVPAINSTQAATLNLVCFVMYYCWLLGGAVAFLQSYLEPWVKPVVNMTAANVEPWVKPVVNVTAANVAIGLYMLFFMWYFMLPRGCMALFFIFLVGCEIILAERNALQAQIDSQFSVTPFGPATPTFRTPPFSEAAQKEEEIILAEDNALQANIDSHREKTRPQNGTAEVSHYTNSVAPAPIQCASPGYPMKVADPCDVRNLSDKDRDLVKEHDYSRCDIEKSQFQSGGTSNQDVSSSQGPVARAPQAVNRCKRDSDKRGFANDGGNHKKRSHNMDAAAANRSNLDSDLNGFANDGENHKKRSHDLLSRSNLDEVDDKEGNSRTMMVVTNCPDNSYDETVQTLKFATRARKIQIGSEVLARDKEYTEGKLRSLKSSHPQLQDNDKHRTQEQGNLKAPKKLCKNNDEMAAHLKKEHPAFELQRMQKKRHIFQHQKHKEFIMEAQGAGGKSPNETILLQNIMANSSTVSDGAVSSSCRTSNDLKPPTMYAVDGELSEDENCDASMQTVDDEFMDLCDDQTESINHQDGSLHMHCIQDTVKPLFDTEQLLYDGEHDKTNFVLFRKNSDAWLDQSSGDLIFASAGRLKLLIFHAHFADTKLAVHSTKSSKTLAVLQMRLYYIQQHFGMISVLSTGNDAVTLPKSTLNKVEEFLAATEDALPSMDEKDKGIAFLKSGWEVIKSDSKFKLSHSTVTTQHNRSESLFSFNRDDKWEGSTEGLLAHVFGVVHQNARCKRAGNLKNPIWKNLFRLFDCETTTEQLGQKISVNVEDLPVMEVDDSFVSSVEETFRNSPETKQVVMEGSDVVFTVWLVPESPEQQDLVMRTVQCLQVTSECQSLGFYPLSSIGRFAIGTRQYIRATAPQADMTGEAFLKTNPDAGMLRYWIRLLSMTQFFCDVSCQVRHGDIQPSNIVCRDLSHEDHKPKLFLNDQGTLVDFVDLTEVDKKGFTAALQYCPTFINWKHGHIGADNKRIEYIDCGTPHYSSFEMILGGEFTMMTPAQDAFSFALTVLKAVTGMDILELMEPIKPLPLFTKALRHHWGVRFPFGNYPEADLEIYAQFLYALLVLLHLDSPKNEHNKMPMMFHWIEEYYNFGLRRLWSDSNLRLEYLAAVSQFSLINGQATSIQNLKESQVFKSPRQCVWFFFRFLFPVPALRAFPEETALCV